MASPAQRERGHGDTRWGFRSRLIILKILPSPFDTLYTCFSPFMLVILIFPLICAISFSDDVFCLFY